MSEPLDVDILANLTDPDAVAEAEALRLVRVGAGAHPAAVWLAQTVFGEVRCTSSLQLRRLRGRIATELARTATSVPRALLRRAALAVDSDLTPDPELFLNRGVVGNATHGSRTRRGSRGAALSASTTAQRLAAECQGTG